MSSSFNEFEGSYAQALNGLSLMAHKDKAGWSKDPNWKVQLPKGAIESKRVGYDPKSGVTQKFLGSHGNGIKMAQGLVAMAVCCVGKSRLSEAPYVRELVNSIPEPSVQIPAKANQKVQLKHFHYFLLVQAFGLEDAKPDATGLLEAYNQALAEARGIIAGFEGNYFEEFGVQLPKVSGEEAHPAFALIDRKETLKRKLASLEGFEQPKRGEVNLLDHRIYYGWKNSPFIRLKDTEYVLPESIKIPNFDGVIWKSGDRKARRVAFSLGAKEANGDDKLSFYKEEAVLRHMFAIMGQRLRQPLECALIKIFDRVSELTLESKMDPKPDLDELKEDGSLLIKQLFERAADQKNMADFAKSQSFFSEEATTDNVSLYDFLVTPTAETVEQALEDIPIFKALGVLPDKFRESLFKKLVRAQQKSFNESVEKGERFGQGLVKEEVIFFNILQQLVPALTILQKDAITMKGGLDLHRATRPDKDPLSQFLGKFILGFEVFYRTIHELVAPINRKSYLPHLENFAMDEKNLLALEKILLSYLEEVANLEITIPAR